MDAILQILNDWRESQNFALVLPWLRAVFCGFLVLAFVAASVSPDELLAALRSAIRHTGLSDKQIAAEMGVTHGLASLKLHGQRPLTLQAASKLPRETLQWFAVELSALVGVPSQVRVGQRLRQARMALPNNNRKAGAA